MYVGKYTSPMDGKGTVFVWGHTIPSESRPKIRNRQQVVEKLVVAVDVDCSGTLSFPEYLFLMRLGECCRVGSSMQHWHALATSLGHVFLASFFSVFQESSWTWNTAVGGPDNSDKSIQKCISDTVSYLVVFWCQHDLCVSPQGRNSAFDPMRGQWQGGVRAAQNHHSTSFSRLIISCYIIFPNLSCSSTAIGPSDKFVAGVGLRARSRGLQAAWHGIAWHS